jgi:uncharacterized protein YegL
MHTKEVPTLAGILAVGVAVVVALAELRRSAPGNEAPGTAPPDFALLLVVDKSGSMAGRNLDILKEACMTTARNLSPKDVFGILAFDDNPVLVLEFTEAKRIDYISERVWRLPASGGTRLYPALVAALDLFERDGRASRSGVRHAILLSDGDTPPGDVESVVRKMAGEGITVSTVCISGPKMDAALMSQIASWGKGRFKFTSTFEKVPELFMNEMMQAREAVPKKG